MSKFKQYIEQIQLELDSNSEQLDESISRSMLAGGLLILSALSALNLEAANGTQHSQQTTMTKKAKKMIIDDTVPLLQRIKNLIPALMKVESNGDVNAVGDNGKAKGILQIWNIVIQDVNRVYKTMFKHDDAFDKSKAIDIATKYLEHYGKTYEKQTGKPATTEVLARIFNGGPTGWKTKATDGYWNKVKSTYSTLVGKNNV